MRWFACFLVCLGFLATREIAADQDDDDLDNFMGLGMLYTDSGDQVDPHDMMPLGYSSEGGTGGEAGLVGDEKDENSNEKGNCEVDQEPLKRVERQLVECKGQVSELETNIKIQQEKSLLMQKKHAKESSTDMQAFYTRLIRHLWTILDLDEAWSILKDDGTALLRHLTVHVTLNDLDVLHRFLQNGQHIHQVDQFVEQSFTLDEPPDDYEGSSIQVFFTLLLKGFEIGKNVEVWLYILCVGFLLLAFWAVILFIHDIHRELRWGRILMMMMVLVFFICCLWHWRHMHKLAESKRHAQMVKRGFTDLPEECKPGGKGTTGSVFEWIKVNIFFSPDVCEKYFEEMMIDPMEEITPAMVIAETLAKFCLQPLQHIGSEVAKLITNFYGNVPAIYHVPATVVSLVLLVIILFYAFGYGIDFPLWMGGIRPIYRTETADTSETDRITREAITQLNQDRERFLEESRAILGDITRAASVVQGQRDLQPLMYMSSHILENQLEQLISRQLSTVLNQDSARQVSDSSLHSDIPNSNSLVVSGGRIHCASSEHRIQTVTSTPLRSNSQTTECSEEGESLRKRSVQTYERSSSKNKYRNIDSSEEATKGNREKSSKSSSKQDGSSEVDSGSMNYRPGISSSYISSNRPVGLGVSTDGVHHRLRGLPKESILPPKRTNLDGGSTGSLEERKEVKPRRKRLEKGKLGHSEGDLDEGEGWRSRFGRLGRKFHSSNSVDRDSSPSPSSTNTNTSTQSLDQDQQPSESDLEVFDKPGTSGVGKFSYVDTGTSHSTSTSGEFYNQVMHLLEESANSSQNESQIEVMNSSPNTSHHPDESELSASGTKFLTTMKALDSEDKC